MAVFSGVGGLAGALCSGVAPLLPGEAAAWGVGHACVAAGMFVFFFGGITGYNELAESKCRNREYTKGAI